ncbi:hypothetical protein ES703_58051 [subsurface metagenome]
MAFVVKSPKQFGKAIKARRLEMGLNQAQTAKRLGLTRSGLCRLEQGHGGPKQETFNKIAQTLNIPKRKFTDWAKKGGDDMNETATELKALRKDFAGLTEALKGVVSQDTKNPTLPDTSEITGSKAQIVKAVADLQTRMDVVENGVANPGPAEAEVEDEESVTIEQNIESSLDEFEGTGEEIGFFDDLFDSEEKDRLKKKAHHESVELCNRHDADPYDEVRDGLFGNPKRADKMADLFYDFARGSIDKNEATKDLVEILGEEEESE